MDTTTWSILVLVERRVNIAIYLQGSHALQSMQIIESDQGYRDMYLDTWQKSNAHQNNSENNLHSGLK